MGLGWGGSGGHSLSKEYLPYLPDTSMNELRCIAFLSHGPPLRSALIPKRLTRREIMEPLLLPRTDLRPECASSRNSAGETEIETCRRS